VTGEANGKIFINYRRGDDPGFARSLFDRLKIIFGEKNVFMDVDTLGATNDFATVLAEEVRDVAAFSPDGRTILSAWKGQLSAPLLSDTLTGEELRNFNGRASINSLVFSPDGRTVLSGDERSVKLWDVATGVKLWDVAPQIKQEMSQRLVHVMGFSRDSRLALTGGIAYDLKVWDVASGKQLVSIPYSSASSAVFSPDARSIISGGSLVYVWDVATGKKLHSFNASAHVSSVAVSRDGLFALSGGSDGYIRLWNVQTGAEVKRILAHEAWVAAVAFSPDGQTVLSTGCDSGVNVREATAHCIEYSMKLWDLTTGKELHTFSDHSGQEQVDSVAYSPNGRLALSDCASEFCYGEHKLRLWDLSPYLPAAR
jgi:WD40 repeat protein